MTKIANRDGRAALKLADSYFDIERASDGRLPASIGELYERWDEFLQWASAAKPSDDALVSADASFDTLAPRWAQVLAVGINHPAKLKAFGLQAPADVGILVKASSALAGAVDTIELTSPKVVAEVELALIVGRPTFRIAKANALNHLAGVTVGLDLADIDGFVELEPLQPGGRTLRYHDPGKSSPGFAPLGPDLVTLDEIGEIGDLRLTLEIDGVRVQDGRPSEFVNGVEQIVHRLSQRIALAPGDVILTGSPGQVPEHPLAALRDGAELVADISGVGRQTHRTATAALVG